MTEPEYLAALRQMHVDGWLGYYCSEVLGQYMKQPVPEGSRPRSTCDKRWADALGPTPEDE